MLLKMRAIKYIVIHCTATPQTTTVESIQNYWRKNLGWKSPGYHFIILPNGAVRNLLSIEQVSNGVAGFNSNSIHISYIGGIDASGKPVDNRTPFQKESMLKLIKDLKRKFPKAVIQGHRDFPNVKKSCPSFNAKTEYSNI
jgi:N-acetylmuramoyl-L-alanine amidase